MTEILAIIQFLLIVYILFKEVNHKSPVSLMWATLVLIFGIAHLITIIFNQGKYENNNLINVSLFVILFCCIYIITREVLWRTNSGKIFLSNFVYSKLKFGNIFEFHLIKYVFFLVIVIHIVMLVNAVGSISNISWGNIYAYSQSMKYINSKTIIHILYFSSGGIICCQMINRDYISLIQSIILVSSYALIHGGNRIIILPVLISIISYFILKNNNINFKIIMIYAVLGIIALFSVYAILILRHYEGGIWDAINNLTIIDMFNRIMVYIQNEKGELGLKNVFYTFMANDGNYVDFLEGNTYIRMLLIYIPTRFSFGIKPDDFAISMGQAMNMGPGASTHPTLFGTCYANMGWYGIFLGLFWACYAYFFDYLLLKFKKKYIAVMAYVLLGSSYVIMGRGSVYNGFFDVAWGFPVLKMMEHINFSICKHKEENRQSLNMG